MKALVAEIHQEVQEIFQDLTGSDAVCIGEVEARVSEAVSSWGAKIIRGDCV